MKKLKRFVFFLLVVLIIWFAGHFFSSPLSQKGEISLENFIHCHIQTMHIENETRIGRAVRIKDVVQTESLLDTLGGLEVRKALPWEKIHEDEEYPYTICLRYESESSGPFENILCWKNGQIDFRNVSYMIAEGSKTQMTDRLEWLVQNYETEE